MKKSLIRLSGLALILACTSTASIASPQGGISEPDIAAPALLAQATPTAKASTPAKNAATPVSVTVNVTWQSVCIEIKGKSAVLHDYNPSLRKRSIVVSDATLTGDEQKIAVSKGLIDNVQVHRLDGNKVVIDIYALGNPLITRQAQDTKFIVSLNDMDNTAKAPAADKAQTPAAKAPAADKAQTPAAKTPAVDKTQTPAAKAPAAEKSPAAAPPPEPVPVTVKINSAGDIVSFDVNWIGDVKVKEFPYNPAKGMHTFVFTPAVLSTPEEAVKINRGIIQTIRTRRIDSKTVAVDIMAYNEPTVKAKERTSPGASYVINIADMTKVTETDPGDKETAQPAASGAAEPTKAPEQKPAAATPAVSEQKTPAAASTAPEAPKASPSADTASVPQVTAAPKVTSNVSTESSAAPAQPAALLPSERVCDYFTMAGRDVQSLVNSMKGLFPNVRFQADPVLNVILVEGPAKDIEEVRKLINVQ